MWFRGMEYNCWGQEDGGEELRIEINRDKCRCLVMEAKARKGL
jgi:hypothetical protein